MADTYVLVHGAWHTGELMEPVAQHLRAQGHTVFCPTLAGNRPGDDRSATGLADAVASLVDFLHQHDLKEVRLMGHSYGGMVISHAADQVAHRIRRLVYWNAFVPLDGERLNNLVPPHYVALFDGIAAASDAVAVATADAVYVLRRGRQTKVAFRDLSLDEASDGAGGGVVRAPMHGKVLSVMVVEGAEVTRGQRLAIIEAMKMEHTLVAPIDGTVSEIAVMKDDQVAEGAKVVVIVANE